MKNQSAIESLLPQVLLPLAKKGACEEGLQLIPTPGAEFNSAALGQYRSRNLAGSGPPRGHSHLPVGAAAELGSFLYTAGSPAPASQSLVRGLAVR